MRLFRIIGAFSVLSVLSACAGFGVGYDITNMRNAEATGDDFTKALTEEYRELTLFEADEMYDWRDAGYYARKGLRAAGGERVGPQEIEDRDLPSDKVGELTAARGELVGLLDASARDKVPQLAGHAQGRFDCWMEQQEENFQTEHIAACRDGFYDALEKLKAAMAPKPEPAPAPKPEPMAAPEPFLIYFAFDSAEVTSAGLDIVARAVAAAKKMGTKEFAITGHADRAGPEEYNLGLSLRRANAVRDALVARGADPAGISVAGRGEAENAVPTADGVREPANRRVEIIVVP